MGSFDVGPVANTPFVPIERGWSCPMVRDQSPQGFMYLYDAAAQPGTAENGHGERFLVATISSCLKLLRRMVDPRIYLVHWVGGGRPPVWRKVVRLSADMSDEFTGPALLDLEPENGKPTHHYWHCRPETVDIGRMVQIWPRVEQGPPPHVQRKQATGEQR